MIHADASGPLCLFPSTAALPAQPALIICSSEIKQVALFWCLSHLPSEEALLGKKVEDWFTSIHSLFWG